MITANVNEILASINTNMNRKEYRDIFPAIYKTGKYDQADMLYALAFIEQLRLRADIVDMFNMNSPCLPDYIPAWLAMYLSDTIIIDEPADILIDISSMLAQDVAMDIFESEFNETHEIAGEELSSHNGIRPVSIHTLTAMADIAKRHCFNANDSYSARMPKMPLAEVLSDTYKKSLPIIVNLNLNIDDYSDKEILDDMAFLLKKWRAELSIDEECETKGVSVIALKKAINNKYLPLLDAIIANKVFNGAVSDSIVLDTLYPSMDIEVDSLRKTYKHQAMKFADTRYVSTWKRTLTKLGSDDLTVKDALTKKF